MSAEEEIKKRVEIEKIRRELIKKQRKQSLICEIEALKTNDSRRKLEWTKEALNHSVLAIFLEHLQ